MTYEPNVWNRKTREVERAGLKRKGFEYVPRSGDYRRSEIYQSASPVYQAPLSDDRSSGRRTSALRMQMYPDGISILMLIHDKASYAEIFCRTSKMSHAGSWRAACNITKNVLPFHFEKAFRSTRRDRSQRWLWRLVGLGEGRNTPRSRSMFFL